MAREVSRCAAAHRGAKKVARAVKNRSWGILGGLRGKIGVRECRARYAARNAQEARPSADEPARGGQAPMNADAPASGGRNRNGGNQLHTRKGRNQRLPRWASELPTVVELEILRVLWEKGPSTVNAVWDVIAQARPVGRTSVQTMLEIMARKRLVSVDRSERAYVYRAKESQELVGRRMVTDLVNRVAEKSVPQLLKWALDGRRMLPEEIEAMRWLVDEAERRMEGR